MIKKILYGKLGKSVIFNKKKWGAFGGDNEAPILFSELARRNPDVEFLMGNANDLGRVTDKNRADYIAVPPNIRSIIDSKDDSTSFRAKLENEKPDACVFYTGPHGTYNAHGIVEKLDGKGLNRTQDSLDRYCGRWIHALNHLSYDLPIVGLMPDNRYKLRCIDWFRNRPWLMLAQCDWDRKNRALTDMPRRTETPMQDIAAYSGLETVFLIGRERPKPVTKDRRGIILTMNQGISTGGIDRWEILKEWLGKGQYFGDGEALPLTIYGKWNEELLRKYPYVFKGAAWLDEIQDVITSKRITFCVPVVKGFATAKWAESLYYGLVPFLHPMYDSQYNVFPKDHFLRVKTPQELRDKISKVNNDDDFYVNLIENSRATYLRGGYYDGSILCDRIMAALRFCSDPKHERSLPAAKEMLLNI